VPAGDPVTVSATVRNVGDDEGTFDARLRDDTDLFETESVDLDEGENRTFEWTVRYGEPGTNRLFVSWNYVGDIEVTEPVLGNESVEVLETSVPRSTVVRGESYRVLATVGNTGDRTGVLPVEYAADGTAVGTDRPVVDPGEAMATSHDAGTTNATGQVNWTVNGRSAGNVTVLSPEAAESGIVDIYTTTERVVSGESYRVVPVVYNAGNESMTYAMAFRREDGRVEALRLVEIPPGATRAVPMERTATDAQEGTTLRWVVSDRTAPGVTVSDG
jgi:hypothetical protein